MANVTRAKDAAMLLALADLNRQEIRADAPPIAPIAPAARWQDQGHCALLW
jgi:hypothetical protein